MVRRWARSGMGQSCSWSQLNALSGLNRGEYQASTDSSLPRLGIRRNLNATCPPGPLAETLRPHKRKPPPHLIASAPPPALAPQHISRPERSDSRKEFDENSPFEPADYDRYVCKAHRMPCGVVGSIETSRRGDSAHPGKSRQTEFDPDQMPPNERARFALLDGRGHGAASSPCRCL